MKESERFIYDTNTKQFPRQHFSAIEVDMCAESVFKVSIESDIVSRQSAIRMP